MTHLAVITAAGLASIIAGEIKTLRRLRPAVVPANPAHHPIDR